MYKRIAVAVHRADDNSRDALALAVTLARTTGASLVLTSIWVSPLGPGDGIYDHAIRGEAEREARLLAEDIPEDVQHEIAVRGAISVIRGLHDLAESDSIDLLVLGPTHLGPIARRLRGDLGINALHDAPCAVVVAVKQQRVRRGDMREVVVAFDDSPEADVALETAIDLAEASGASLRVVRVVDTPYAFNAEPWIGADGQQHWLHSVTEAAKASLDNARTRAAGRVTVITDLREGITAAELRDAAHTADLIVTGSRGHGAVTRMVIGSTAGALLRDHPCPVLVTPRPAHVREPAAARA